MATPSRLPDFDMSSARKPETPHMGLHTPGKATPGGPRSDMEQRMARVVAESEYKLLEERTRAHEREAQLKEELARERARVPVLVEERVEAALKGRGAAVAAPANDTDTQKKLQETQQLLADAERRYQQERRELLNLRTTQLRTETAKRGQEGDIIGRAMQVMTEYETIVRASEENSLTRLKHHMETFEGEWLQRSKEFEERKADFETVVMGKALDALKEHNQDVEAIGEQVLSRTVELIRQQGQSRLQLEQQVLEQAEVFKQQYKELLDKEFQDRCAVYDAKLAARERNLVGIVQEERERIIAAEREAVQRAEDNHVDALASAMADVSKLREQVVAEHQKAQEQAVSDLVSRREKEREEHRCVIQQAAERFATLEKQCADAVQASQTAVKEAQLAKAESDAELSRQIIELQTKHENEKLRDVEAARQDIEAEWRKALAKLQQDHQEELSASREEAQARLDKEYGVQFQREQEQRRQHEERLKKAEEAMEQRWEARVRDAQQSVERHAEMLEALTQDNGRLTDQLLHSQQALAQREAEVQARVQTVQREQEQQWHARLEEMRQRYDQLLDEALGGPRGDTVSRAEHDKLMESLHELEERCVEMRRSEADRIARERQQLNDTWRARLDQERVDRGSWEEEQLARVAEMRTELEADVRRKEAEAQRRAESERRRLHDESQLRTVEDRKDREAFEQRQREEFNGRVREAEEGLNAAYTERVAVLERRVEEKEAALDKQRNNLKAEMAAFEAQSKQQAAQWLEREKEAILADVKRFHERLTAEQERMEEERARYEQSVSMRYAELFENAKSDLHSKLLDVTNIHVSYWQRCEQEWLDYRSEEMALVYRLRNEHEAKMHEFVVNATANAQELARQQLAAEQRVLDEKEANLYAEIEQARLAQEAASRERALRLLDERNKIQEEAAQQRALEETRLWEVLEKRVLEKEQQAEASRRILELDLRTRYEGMISAERQRVDQMMETHRKETRVLYEKHEAHIREREEEWHRQRLAIELAEKQAHEQQYHELRTQCEERIQDERSRFENALRTREEEFEGERKRLLDGVTGHFKEHEGALQSRVSLIKGDYEQRIKALALENQSQREQHLVDLAEQERKYQAARDDFEADATQRFESAMSELKQQLEQRVREQQARDASQREALESARRDYEQKVNGEFQKLLQEHEAKLLSLQTEQEEKNSTNGLEAQRLLLSARAEMEQRLKENFTAADARAREAADALRLQFQERLDEFNSVLGEERRKRHDSEDKLSQTLDELQQLRGSVEQHRLEAQRTAQSHYEHLIHEERDRVAREREAEARRQLQEDERRLAQELLRSQPQVGSQAVARDAALAPRAAAPRDDGNSQLLDQVMEKLRQLWAVTETPDRDQQAFTARISALASESRVDAVGREVRHLETQLPLLEAVTRREFLKQRLEELRATSPQSVEVDSVAAELSRVTEQLLQDVPQYEGRFGVPFFFRGERFLSAMRSA